MELRQIRYFLAVAENKNLSRAADCLKMAQPPLSRQIQALEKELGVELFMRKRSGVELTEAGRHFQRETQRLMTQLAILSTETQQIGRGAGRQLRIGTDWRIPIGMLSMASQELRRLNPSTDVCFVDLPNHEQVGAMREGRIDLGVIPTASVRRAKHLVITPIYDPAVYVAMPAGHPLANAETVKISELKNERWLILEAKSAPGFEALVREVCHGAGFTPKISPSSASLDGLLARVAAGEGICFTLQELGNRSTVALDSLRFVRCREVHFELSAVWLPDRDHPLIQDYVKILRAMVKS